MGRGHRQMVQNMRLLNRQAQVRNWNLFAQRMLVLAIACGLSFWAGMVFGSR